MSYSEPCHLCEGTVRLVSGHVIYPHRSDLHEKWFWRCIECKAYVGCHSGSQKPLGTVADRMTRHWRSRAHAAFDPLWKKKGSGYNNTKRRDAYKWLSEELGIEWSDCHIGQFTVKQCQDVVRICTLRRRSVT